MPTQPSRTCNKLLLALLLMLPRSIRSMNTTASRTAARRPTGEKRTLKAKVFGVLESVRNTFWRDPSKPLVFAGLLVVGVQAYPHVKKAISSRSSTQDDHYYVKRPALESRFSDTVERSRGEYCVLYGPSGSGKSEILNRYAVGAEDLVKVSVDCTKPWVHVRASLHMKLLGTRPEQTPTKAALKAAVSKSMTIIFEVECGGDQDAVLPDVYYLAEALGPYCHRCIVVLSEPYTVNHFHRNSFRSQFLYVNEMTNEEAKQLVQRLLEREEFKADGREAFEFSDEELQYVFDTIGTNPMLLKRMVGEVVGLKRPLEQFVRDVLDQAELDLVAFPHQQILKALKEHPDGIPLKYFHGKKNKGIHLHVPNMVPWGVGPAIRDTKAIVYRMELRQYQLISTAHKTALKSYDPASYHSNNAEVARLE